jgi:glycosyltransferase involved in cell wall biosynthesis
VPVSNARQKLKSVQAIVFMPKKTSWIIPVKNGMPYICETLISLAAQTLQDFEVLVWDNGSNDGTVEEVRKWLPGRLHGRIITNSPLPLAKSLAALVENAEGEYCARIDADDLAHPDRLRQQVAMLESRPKVVAVGCRYDAIDSDGNPCRYDYWLPTDYTDILHGLFINNCLLHPGMTFRRSAVLAAGNYRMESPVEDYDLWLRLAQHGEIIALSEPLVRYRVRPDSVTAVNLKAAKMDDAVDRAWFTNISGFAGLPLETARRLRTCSARFVDWQLWRAHRTFCKRDGLSYRQRLRTESFHRVLARYKI